MSISSSSVSSKTKYKIVLLGDSQVGKTSLIDRFINDRFQTSYNATIGIDFLVKNVTFNNRNYRLQLWDTAGQQRFKSLIPSYLKDSNVCILVYDQGSIESLEHISKWHELYNQHKQYTAFSVLVGNKSDLSVKHCTEEIVKEKLKTMKDVQHFLISAKTGDGVTELFHKLIDLIAQRLSNIKIIEQIDEKQEKEQKDDRSVQGTAKPVFQQKKKGEKLQQPVKVKSKCC